MWNQANTKTGSQDIMENNSNFDFSVIVCCYNPDFEKLKKTIISIVNQKEVSFEIIKKGAKLILPKTISSVWREKAGQEKLEV